MTALTTQTTTKAAKVLPVTIRSSSIAECTSTALIADSKALAILNARVPGALVLANKNLSAVVQTAIYHRAIQNGSKTKEHVRYKHFQDGTAKACFPDMKKSDAETIRAMPMTEQAIVTIVRQGVSNRLEGWAATEQAIGGFKPHNRPLKISNTWSAGTADILRDLSIPELTAEFIKVFGDDHAYSD